jgi:hypothetical protein
VKTAEKKREVIAEGSIKGGKEENSNKINNGRRRTRVLFKEAMNCKFHTASVVDE